MAKVETDKLWVADPIAQMRPDEFVNDSGIYPVEYKCLIMLDPVLEKSEGGIFIPQDRQERDQEAKIEALLVAHGGNCFEDWKRDIPVPGDRVIISKYAGDGMKLAEKGEAKPYRLCNDKEVAAIDRRPR